MSPAIAEAFDATLRTVRTNGQFTRDDLLRLYGSKTDSPRTERGSPVVPSLEQVQFYADVAADPEVLNAQYRRDREEAERTYREDHVWEVLRTNKHHQWRKQRRFDFRLNEEEKRRLRQHGLMVYERLGESSFADVYYKLYTDDMPVFVTSDSIFHAWHCSFDVFLMDLEMQELMPLLGLTLSKYVGCLCGRDHHGRRE